MNAQAYQKLRKRFLVAFARRLSTCQEATALISTSLEQRLTLQKKISLKLHLFTCSLCRRYEQQLRFLHHAAHQLEQVPQQPTAGTTQTLPSEARARMRRAMQSPLMEE